MQCSTILGHISLCTCANVSWRNLTRYGTAGEDGRYGLSNFTRCCQIVLWGDDTNLGAASEFGSSCCSISSLELGNRRVFVCQFEESNMVVFYCIALLYYIFSRAIAYSNKRMTESSGSDTHWPWCESWVCLLSAVWLNLLGSSTSHLSRGNKNNMDLTGLFWEWRQSIQSALLQHQKLSLINSALP